MPDMSDTVARPKRGRPKQGTEQATAVALTEAEVVRLRVKGRSFPAIDAELGITNSDRVFATAARKLPARSREEAYALESARLDALHEKAWATLDDEWLEALAVRVAALIEDPDVDDRYVRHVIGSAYADTLRAVPVVLKVGERRDKLDGLTHADRVADARLDLDRTILDGMAVALAESLGLLEDVPLEAKRAVLRSFAERMKAFDTGES